jgi:MFS family permease
VGRGPAAGGDLPGRPPGPIAPAALAIIITNFPEGPQRSRATSVYASVSALASAVGLVVGGLLAPYASWRWTLIVNVPIGLVPA